MGPPPFGDGKSSKALMSSLMSVLQWGHRLSAMESATQYPEAKT